MLNFKLYLLALGLAASTTANTPNSNTGVAEVDLVFPQNDTFQPMEILPIVFAIQNNPLIQQLSPTLHYRVIPYHQPPNATFQPLDYLDIYNLPGNGTQYLYTGIANLANTDGTWRLDWAMGWYGCSKSENGTSFIQSRLDLRSFQ